MFHRLVGVDPFTGVVPGVVVAGVVVDAGVVAGVVVAGGVVGDDWEGELEVSPPDEETELTLLPELDAEDGALLADDVDGGAAVADVEAVAFAAAVDAE